ncbi:MAG: tRNA preQ1(34) S-adenosylmethionine ribosyltransferase-isomerase QueA [Alphaproteobacteria bacterium]|nr:tRNA preQ1(34) S-adenosylmethionine ribosyltransferase-isomerase QueA [Alphaproteobacteria bacterium]
MDDLRTDAFDFDLPPDRIAQQACEPRDHARLLCLTPEEQKDRHVYDLPDILRPDDILVLNDTRVIPARLYGTRDAVRVEILLHKKQSDGTWLAFARPGKRLRVGQTVRFGPDFSAEILEKRECGEVVVRFAAPDHDLLRLLNRYGEAPLPPYIKRAPGEARADKDRYQTVFAARDGAVAAPTAGLHFTPALLETLKAKGIETAIVTLHVGAGTFLPVKTEHIRDHIMHAEWGEITPEVAQTLNAAHKQGRRIIAVGTTSLRVLESSTDEAGIIHPFAQETSIFITPGYRFRAVDVLLTNFHLPRSTLFMLVAAFMGLERMKAAYAHAIKEHYRFYSYGDACLLEKGASF